MAVRRRRGLGVAALALFILAVLSGSAVARAEEDGVSNPDAGLDGAFGADADQIAVDDDDASDELPTSEDAPVHKFETTVVTVGKASGKEKRKDVSAFFLRGDDAAAAATRFVYVNALPLSQIAHFTETFAREWDENVPEEKKPRPKRAASRRSTPMGPRAYLERGKQLASEDKHDESRFDFARALAGTHENDADGSADPESALTADERAEATELLEQHHRKHSRALNALEKQRETRERAHEREVSVFWNRRDARAAAAETEADFFQLWDERFGSRVRSAATEETEVEKTEQTEQTEGDVPSSPREKTVSLAHDLALHAAVEAKDWDRVLEVSRSFERDASVRASSVPEPDSLVALRRLALARAHWHRREWRSAELAANACVSSGRTAGDWRRGQVRAVAVATGAYSAVRRGDSEGALKFLAFAKRADPDTPLFKKPYALIKEAEKLLKDADLKLDRGESRQAMESADEAVAKLRGLGGDDPCASGPNGCSGVAAISRATHGMFSGADARRCRAHAQMRAFDSALEACERSLRALGCVEGFVNPDDTKAAEKACASADPRRRARALLARGETHARDAYFEGALFDLRVALEVIEPVANRGSAEATTLLSEIREKTHVYERDRRAHEHDRDHFAQLDLPENLRELPKDRRCEFVKKAFKKAALKWHPDKAMEAGKARAARKMNEMTEARDHVNVKLLCVEPKADPDEQRGRQQPGPGGYTRQQAYQQYYQQQQRQRPPGGQGQRSGGQYRHSWEF
jgi:curved DNA-binding protein CbpA